MFSNNLLVQLRTSIVGCGFLLGAIVAAMPAFAQSGATAAAPSDRYVLPAQPAPVPVSREEFAQRRAALARSMEDGFLVVFGSGEPELDFLPYAQNSPFRYLTGIVEPGAALVMEKRGPAVIETLFVRPKDPSREIWDGFRLGSSGATQQTGIPARSAETLRTALDSLATSHRTFYALAVPPTARDGDETLSRDQQIVRDVAQRHPGVRVTSLAGALDRLRATKSAVELDLIRRAVLVSVLAHREAIRSTAPGMNEFEIQALVEYVFRRNGAERPAYSSIVGSGPNSTTLHYRDADRYMNAGEVLLMDVGAAYRGYAADVTRTVPVSGTFTPDQRAIYQIVLDAQKAAESQVRVGGTWREVDGAANQVIAAGLARLGLIDAPDATYDCGSGTQRCSQIRLYYMHGLGHGVGLDVHDPEISTYTSFQVGSAFTIEPGVYVRQDVLDFLPDTPGNRAMIGRLRGAVERYRNIGVRIEDVFLITPQGVERASQGVPREAAEVEALMAERGLGEVDRRPEVVEWYRGTTPR